MTMLGRLRLPVLAVVACALAGCATAEDYLTTINPFRRADQAGQPSASPVPASEPAAPPRTGEAPR